MSADCEPDIDVFMVFGGVVAFMLEVSKVRHGEVTSPVRAAKLVSNLRKKKKEKKSFYCLAVEYVFHLQMRNHIISKIPTHVFCGMKDSWNNVKISGSPDCGNIFSGVKFKHF